MPNREYNEFEALLNEYLPPEEKGRVKVVGKISQLDRNFAILEAMGQPKDIRVRAEELTDYNQGEEVEVLITGETEDGEFLVGSRRRIDMEEGMKEIEGAFEKRIILQCKITRKINGGYIIEYKKQQGFLPNSLSEIPMRNSDNVIGQNIEVIVKDIKADKKGKRITFSKKDISMAKEAEQFEIIKAGDVMESEITDVLEFGLNVKIGVIRGFIHISEISWKKIDNLKELYKAGEKLTVKVISADKEKHTLKLSIKALKRNPWEVATENFEIGTEVEGKVTRIQPYGAFVEICDGVEGLVHVSDLTWNKKKINVSDFIKIGDVVKVKIMEFDASSRKLKLGVKQLCKNPWDNAETKFGKGEKLSGKVLDVKPFGIFVEVESGVDAFIHQSDLAWQGEETPKIKAGDHVEFEVTEVNLEENRIKGSIKALVKSPWDKAIDELKVGDRLEREIKNIMDFGMFITIFKGVDGFIPAQFASKDFIKNLKERFKVGDMVTAEIVEIDREKKKIKLSMKKIEMDSAKKEERDLIAKYSESSSK
ncbi:MAG: S1 RNA-binding domain-containing protein [Fusobacteriaceae bacterium]